MKFQNTNTVADYNSEYITNGKQVFKVFGFGNNTFYCKSLNTGITTELKSGSVFIAKRILDISSNSNSFLFCEDVHFKLLDNILLDLGIKYNIVKSFEEFNNEFDEICDGVITDLFLPLTEFENPLLYGLSIFFKVKSQFKIPSYIVTSTYHHNKEIEPVWSIMLSTNNQDCFIDNVDKTDYESYKKGIVKCLFHWENNNTNSNIVELV